MQRDQLPADTEGLPEASRPEVVELSDGGEFDLQIAPVNHESGMMFSFNVDDESPVVDS